MLPVTAGPVATDAAALGPHPRRGPKKPKLRSLPEAHGHEARHGRAWPQLGERVPEDSSTSRVYWREPSPWRRTNSSWSLSSSSEGSTPAPTAAGQRAQAGRDLLQQGCSSSPRSGGPSSAAAGATAGKAAPGLRPRSKGTSSRKQLSTSVRQRRISPVISGRRDRPAGSHQQRRATALGRPGWPGHLQLHIPCLRLSAGCRKATLREVPVRPALCCHHAGWHRWTRVRCLRAQSTIGQAPLSRGERSSLSRLGAPWGRPAPALGLREAGLPAAPLTLLPPTLLAPQLPPSGRAAPLGKGWLREAHGGAGDEAGKTTVAQPRGVGPLAAQTTADTRLRQGRRAQESAEGRSQLTFHLPGRPLRPLPVDPVQSLLFLLRPLSFGQSPSIHVLKVHLRH